MPNPFEDNTGQFKVLINDEGQYSLWPSYKEIPRGWHLRHGPAGRQECLDFVEQHWTDMRPRSLAALMDQDSSKKGSFPSGQKK